MKNPSEGSTRGFTLIELLVVIAIIAILAALLMPALEGARTRAGTVACVAQEHQLVLPLMMYISDFERLPWVESVGNASTSAIRNWNESGERKWQGFGLLYRHKYLTTGESFYCPGRDLHCWGYRYTTAAFESNDTNADYVAGWYSGDDISWATCGLSPCYGLRLYRYPNGPFYNVPGGGWNWNDGSGVNQPPWAPFNFAPTLNQYRYDWVRGPSWTAWATGSRVLFTDMKAKWGGFPKDIPHSGGKDTGACNVACIDGRVETLTKGFEPWMETTWLCGMCNELPHHEYGEEWWSWVEGQMQK
jgi:prepilin-type N-terminal cleavage/methylation domain-containing protein